MTKSYKDNIFLKRAAKKLKINLLLI